MKISQLIIRKALIILSVAGCIASSGWATELTLTPAHSSVGLDYATSFDIVISGLGASQDLGAFALDIAFDPLILQVESYNLGDQLGAVGSDALDLSFGASAPGSFNIAETSLLTELSGQSNDDFVIGTIIFKGIGSGMSLLGITGTLGDAGGNGIAYSASTGSVSVPEPNLIPMLAFGLFGLITIRKSVKRKTGLI
jgi:hypothetical protein